MESHKYQATLYVTDEQFSLMRELVEKELKRIATELGKQPSRKVKDKLEDRQYDMKAVLETMKENVW